MGADDDDDDDFEFEPVATELEVLTQAANRLSQVLNGLGCLEVGKVNYRSGEMSFLCRWSNERRWYQILERFLTREKGWESFIAKKMMMRRGQMVAGWYLGFKADDIVAAAERVGGLFLTIQAELDGATSIRGTPIVDYTTQPTSGPPLMKGEIEVEMFGVESNRNELRVIGTHVDGRPMMSAGVREVK